MKVGNGMEEDTEQGPLIDVGAMEIVEAHVRF